MLQSVGEAVGGLLAIPGGAIESSAQIIIFWHRPFSLLALGQNCFVFTFSTIFSIGHSHSGSVDLQDQERSVASGKREVCFKFRTISFFGN